jgi:hypothetical protein
MRFSFTFRSLLSLIATGFLAAFVSPANANLSHWLAEVAAGTPAGYSRIGILSPTADNIGTYSETTNGGVSYEFIVNATNDGASSALMGVFNDPAATGDLAALKWEQWQDTLHLGTTVFGVADFDSGVNNIPNVDTHVVFVNNGTDTLLYVNGASAATIAGSSPTFSGQVGLGQAFAASGNHIDRLTGRIIGVAVYDAALSASEIAAHARAYAIPEPSTLILLLGVASGWLLRRRR